MNIIDISWPLTEHITEYKDRETVTLDPLKDFNRDGVRETQVCFHSHTGTHIDAPSHFLSQGGTIDTVVLSTLIGSCTVVDCTHIESCITANDLHACDIKQGDRVLFKTRNSNHAPTDRFDYEFVYVDASAAQYLVDKGIRAVGIDYLGIERNQPNHETHTILLSNNVVIIEGLRLAEVTPGTYELYCLPLAIHGIDAAPARAILIKC